MVQTICPLKYGTVVYSVRNLYNAITGEINKFEDNCDAGSQNRSSGTTQKIFIRLKEPKKQQTDMPSITKLQVYPNPAKDMVTVSYPKMQQVIVTDVMGRVVKSTLQHGTDKAQINLAGLGKGIFMVRVLGADNASASQKIIIE